MNAKMLFLAGGLIFSAVAVGLADAAASNDGNAEVSMENFQKTDAPSRLHVPLRFDGSADEPAYDIDPADPANPPEVRDGRLVYTVSGQARVLRLGDIRFREPIPLTETLRIKYRVRAESKGAPELSRIAGRLFTTGGTGEFDNWALPRATLELGRWYEDELFVAANYERLNVGDRIDRIRVEVVLDREYDDLEETTVYLDYVAFVDDYKVPGDFAGRRFDPRAYLYPKQHILTPSDNLYPPVDTRQFQGISSLAVSPGGRLWATWYAGPTPAEDENNYVVLATSGDDGETWKEVMVVDPDGPWPIYPTSQVRAFDPNIWVDPGGRLWLFWAQHIRERTDSRNRAGVWAMVTEEPDRAGAKWSEPRRLTDGVMMNKPTVLSDGRWLLPASTWSGTDYSARAVASDDEGKTFEVVGACHIPEEDRRFDEHMFVERNDGSIWMLVRTNYGIGESRSTDRGGSWSDLEPSDIRHPSARFFIRRLNSGNLLLVKHGPIDEQTGRSHLRAFVSKDDGETWEGGFLIDERSGISYPDGQQTADGTIYITYDFQRRDAKRIYMATFAEEDALAGRAVSGRVRERVIISEGLPRDRNPGSPPR